MMWLVHNVVAHPLMGVLHLIGLTRLGNLIHDITVPGDRLEVYLEVYRERRGKSNIDGQWYMRVVEQDEKNAEREKQWRTKLRFTH